MLRVRPLNDSLIKAKRILVVEDDEEIRRLLSVKLTREGFEVFTAPSGQHALDSIAQHGLPHLAIVDINMPIMGGLEFCERVKRFSDVPVIILTAVDESKTVIHAIEQFAEDYVVKPFNLGELVARIRRVLKRIGNFDYTFDAVVQVNASLAIDFSHQTAFVDGEAIALTPTETKLLHIFLTKAGSVVSAEFLLERVWPQEEIYEEALRVHISRLRQKLEGSQKAYKFILTERGRGYRFVTDLPPTTSDHP
ncbi:MAG: response regulator transcription factor [Caldilineaceae bacterium]